MNVLVTARLGGDLALLPRLMTFLRQVRSQLDGPVVLLDLGGACAPSAWPCAATEGRAALYVLDAMGYDMACLSEQDGRLMSPGGVQKLRNGLHMAICGNADLGLSPIVFVQKGPWRIGCAVDDQTAAAQPRDEHTLLIYPGADGSTPQLTGALLRLPPVQRGHLGIVRIIMQQASSGVVQPAGITSRVEAPPPGTRPDATAAAAVDFVLEEAAFYQRQLEGQQVQHDKGGAHEAS